MFLEDLKTFFEGHGYQNIFTDTLPDQPNACIGLFMWAHSVPLISDGTGTRYIQVQVRNMDWDQAYRTAFAMAELLDSGEEEEKIFLTPERWCIARPRAYPKKLVVDGSGRAVYYFETAIWGDNEP